MRDDIKDKGLSGDEVYDCAAWKRVSSNIDPHKGGNKMKKKKNRRRRGICCDVECHLNTSICHKKNEK